MAWTVSLHYLPLVCPNAARQQVCPLRCLLNCRRAQPVATLQSAAVAAPAPLWPSLSASTRWLPATSKSPPTSCMPQRSGIRLNSYRRSRKVHFNAWTHGCIIALSLVVKAMSFFLMFNLNIRKQSRYLGAMTWDLPKLFVFLLCLNLA